MNNLPEVFDKGNGVPLSNGNAVALIQILRHRQTLF